MNFVLCHGQQVSSLKQVNYDNPPVMPILLLPVAPTTPTLGQSPLAPAATCFQC